MAHSHCGATQEALTKTWALTCDHPARLYKAIQQLIMAEVSKLWINSSTVAIKGLLCLPEPSGQNRAKSWHTREIMFSTALF